MRPSCQGKFPRCNLLHWKRIMEPPQPLSRRRFMQSTSAAGLALGTARQAQSSDPAQPRVGETEYFWYREQPPGKYIDSQRGNKAFAYAEGRVFLSLDNSRTWPHSADFS